MSETTRIALGVEYDGSRFQGWQYQENGPTVQAALEAALSKVASHRVETFCAGRTDAGVHAQQQIVHFDTCAVRDFKGWTMGANTNLPPTVRVRWAKPVANDFHARFSATSRTYEYWIYRDKSASSIFRHLAKWHYYPLDVARMNEAAQYLLGERDFTSFRASGCQASGPVREMKEVSVAQFGKMLVVRVKANAFLYHMVRNIVGLLIPVGEGKIEPQAMKTILEARDRKQAGPTAPAHGLHLVSVNYPSKYDLPKSGPSDLAYWMESEE